MKIILLFTAVCTAVSLVKDRKKTKKALKIAVKKFLKMLLPFLTMIILISIVLYFISDELLLKILDNSNKAISLVLASLLGSISIMPGFISFPLCGLLLDKGVSYMVLSAFTTTLMMVGVLSFPIEKAFFGTRVAVIRNIFGFITAIIVSLVTGLVFGELI